MIIRVFSLILFLFSVVDNSQANTKHTKPKLNEEKEIHCLALNIYFEARGESEVGQFAVAAVTMNRVRSPKFPNTVCKVVWQKHQFSWTHDGKSDRPRERRAWKKAKALAQFIYSKYFTFLEKSNGAWDITRGALNYYSPTLANPVWAKSSTDETHIGQHVFLALGS